MSRNYNMYVVVRGFRKERMPQIEEALLSEWEFDEDWIVDESDASRLSISGGGDGCLCGGESEEEFADSLAMAVMKANGGACEVGVRATYLEELPFERYIRDADWFEENVRSCLEVEG